MAVLALIVPMQQALDRVQVGVAGDSQPTDDAWSTAALQERLVRLAADNERLQHERVGSGATAINELRLGRRERRFGPFGHSLQRRGPLQ